jgi:hypothetical protein
MPAGYIALERIALSTGLVEKGEKFASDAVPGKFWKPIDKEAKAAVKARDDAAKAGAVVSADPRVAELERVAAEQAQVIADLQAEVEALTAPPPEADAAK